MFNGGSPRIVAGPAGGGQGQGAKSNANHNWQTSLRSPEPAQRPASSASRVGDTAPSSQRSQRSRTPTRGGASQRTASASASRGAPAGAMVAAEQQKGDIAIPVAGQGGEAQEQQYPYPFPPPGPFNNGFYDPFAGPHPAGYSAPYPVEYDSIAAPHPSAMYPNADYLYDRPVMYNDLPSYMPSYRDLQDRKARKVDTLGREVQEKSGTRKEVAEHMVPPSRIATQGYRPGMSRGAMPSYQVGAGFHGERSAQDVGNSFSHHHHVDDRFERSKHKTDWNSWTRQESEAPRRRRTGRRPQQVRQPSQSLNASASWSRKDSWYNHKLHNATDPRTR